MTEEEKATAYHEAGHAVVAVHLKIPIKSVSIIRNEKERENGSVTYTDKFNKFMNERIEVEDWDYDKMAENQIFVEFAGRLTEKKFSGINNIEGAKHDIATITGLLLKLCRESIETDVTTLEECYSKFEEDTEKFFTDERGNDTAIWNIVCRVAEVLFKKKNLKYSEVKRLYNNLF